MENLIGLMLAGGGPRVIPARGNWPLHQALRELRDRAGARGERRLVEALVLRPSPDVGVRAEGADKAIFQLTQQGFLIVQGTGRQAALHIERDALVALRRNFLRVAPGEAGLIQWAGARWCALASTSAKNRATPSASVGSASVTSSTPNRLGELPGSDSTAVSRRREPRRTRLSTR
jgi:hypothetical protein